MMCSWIVSVVRCCWVLLCRLCLILCWVVLMFVSRLVIVVCRFWFEVSIVVWFLVIVIMMRMLILIEVGVMSD